jgi:hypothetical protein
LLLGYGGIDRVNIEFDIVLAFTGVGEVRALMNYLRARSFSQGAKLFAIRAGNGVEILSKEGGERVAIYGEGVLKEIRFIDEGGEILGTTGKIRFLDNEGKQAENVFQLIRKDGQIGFRRAVSSSDPLLTEEIIKLAEQHISNSGKTVLGSFPDYITKAKNMQASYFDIGDTWNSLTDAQKWAANKHFLDKIALKGDQILLSIEKSKINPGSYLETEIEYLIEQKGYRWINQWSLKK